MTRFARRGTIVTKKPHEASSWSELKRGWQKCHQEGHTKEDCKSNQVSNSFQRRSESEGGPAIRRDKKLKTYIEQKRERRKAEKHLKRIRLKEKSKKCEFCSEHGHLASECPRRVTETNFGACIKCGSTDHTGNNCKGAGVITEPCTRCQQEGHREEDCPVESSDDDDDDDSDDLCPLCHERGHQIKGCPDNPRSIYPRGGCCKECRSVEHKTKLCPTRHSIQDLEEVKVGSLHFGSTESADAFEQETSSGNVKMKLKKKTAKIVVF